VDEVYAYALKLLKSRDYTVAELSNKLQAKFGSLPQHVIQQLLNKNFLNDRRFAENRIASRKHRGRMVLREELIGRGIQPNLAESVLSEAEWPSLQQSLADKMNDWNLRAPLQTRDAARLFRALLRHGYNEDAIREEIERLHEQ
jgi:SOS response regulatory protein OraA/RecX